MSNSALFCGQIAAGSNTQHCTDFLNEVEDVLEGGYLEHLL